MGVEVRGVEPDEIDAYRQAIAVGFGGPTHQPGAEAVIEDDRLFAAVVDGEIAGGVGSYTQEITPAGPASPLPMAAVANVAIVPTHTRQGLLRQLMAELLQQAVDRDETVASLYASEGTIYGRFGFGIATRAVSMKVDTNRSALRTRSSQGGRLRLVHDAEERKALLPRSWEPFRRSQPGEASRTEVWWDVVLGEPSLWIGGGAQHVLVHEPEPGADPDGHCRYRVVPSWGEAGARFTLHVDEMAAVDPEVEAALWQHCFDVDLVTRVEAMRRPHDDPLPWRMVDQRAHWTTSVRDNLWVRVLDVEGALARRGYAGEGSVVIEVDDSFRPATSGRYALEVGEGGATAVCARTDSQADVAMDIDVLGALWLGGVSPWTLARAGRITEEQPGGLAKADRLFPMPQSPLNQTPF